MYNTANDINLAKLFKVAIVISVTKAGWDECTKCLNAKDINN